MTYNRSKTSTFHVISGLYHYFRLLFFSTLFDFIIYLLFAKAFCYMGEPRKPAAWQRTYVGRLNCRTLLDTSYMYMKISAGASLEKIQGVPLPLTPPPPSNRMYDSPELNGARIKEGFGHFSIRLKQCALARFNYPLMLRSLIPACSLAMLWLTGYTMIVFFTLTGSNHALLASHLLKAVCAHAFLSYVQLYL